MPRGKLTAPVSVLTMIESEQHEALRLIAFNERRSVAELVREGIESRGRGRDADLVQQVNRPRAPLRPAAALVLFQGFHDLEADGEARVEARHRLLKDHPHFVSTKPAYFLFG